MAAGLKKIWKNAFADPDWYINFFFENRFKPENTLVYLDNGPPVSMFFMLPAQININGSYKNVHYVYGVSTLSTFQGRGYSTALLKYANDNMPDDISATFLTPATPSLFDFYKKQGYENAFFVKELNLTKNDLENIPASSFGFKMLDAPCYTTIRDKAFEGHGYVKWDIPAMEYMLAENELLGGKAYAVENNDSENIILYRIWGKKLFVKETTLDGEALFAAVKKIMESENLSDCHIRLHHKSLLNEETKAFAMIYGCNGINKGYFNLALD